MLDHKINREAVLAAAQESRKRHFHSAFQFLDAHNGIRRGAYSVVMGTSGCGKTGLAQAIAVQASTSPKAKVLVILTEESKENYAGPMLAYSDLTGCKMENITFFEESSMDHEKLRTHDQFLQEIKEVIVGSYADMVLIDNITTGRLYGTGTSIWDQEKTVWFLKNLVKDLNIHIMVVAHTRKEVTDNMPRLMTIQDHQGAASLGKEAAFLYALQKFTANGSTYVFSRTLKHRGYPDGHGTFALNYDMGLRLYVGDKRVDFERMKEIFKMRDSFGGNK